MKLKKPFLWMGLVVMLVSVLLVFPTAIALGADAAVTPTTAAVGAQVTITGTLWPPSTQIAVYFSSQQMPLGSKIDTNITIYAYVGTTTIDTNGNLSHSFTIPTTLTTGNQPVIPGTYYIYPCIYNQTVSPAAFQVYAVTSINVLGNATLNPASPATGAPGTTVTLTGTNYLPNHAITITFEGTGVTPLTGASTSATGAVATTFNVPYLTAGAHSITVSDGTTTKTTTFTIVPYVVLSTASGPAGTEVTIAGNGFGAVKSVTIYFNNQQVGTNLTSTTGAIDPTKITIPDLGLAAGTYDIKVADSASNLGTTPFQLTVPTQPTPTPTPTATPDISVTPSATGDSLTIDGTGFKASSQIVVQIEGTTVTTATSSTGGAFSVQFDIPATVSAGEHTLSVTDGTNTEQYTFTKTAPPPAPEPQIIVATAGNSVAIQGADFLASSPITITMDGTQIGTGITSNQAGAFAAQFQVASNLSHGEHTISVTDGVHTQTYPYTVESTPPDIPVASAPAPGATPKAPFIFQWSAVTDPSAPVTYDLQISSSATFAADTILVDKTGLALPTYTLMADEQAALAGQSAPYYWHVRAVDAASNASPWSGAMEVHVQSPFAFPRWLMYTLGGVGAIIIFGIGYLVGRRTAFYY
jgi:hypothetical protein